MPDHALVPRRTGAHRASTSRVPAFLPGRRSGAAVTARRRVTVAMAGVGAAGVSVLAPASAIADPEMPSALPSACVLDADRVTCTYTSGTATFTAPAGVTALDLTITGGHGGRGGLEALGGGAGGGGTTLAGQLTLGAGSDRTFQVVVGENGLGTLNGEDRAGGAGTGRGGRGGDSPDYEGAIPVNDGGGGGGGSSFTSSDRTIIAGGGGGGGGGFDGPGGRPAGATTGSRDGGDGESGPFLVPGGGGGGGGVRGGAGGESLADAVSTGGHAGTSSDFGTASTSTAAAGSVVVSYTVPAAPPAEPGVDLVTTIDAPTAVAPGRSATVTVTVTNRGSATAERVRTLVLVPPNLRVTRAPGGAARTAGGDSYRFTEPALAAGASRTYTFTVTAEGPSLRGYVTAQTTSRSPETVLRDNHDRAAIRST